jgi:hypothetical protein
VLVDETFFAFIAHADLTCRVSSDQSLLENGTDRIG